MEHEVDCKMAREYCELLGMKERIEKCEAEGSKLNICCCIEIDGKEKHCEAHKFKIFGGRSPTD